MASEEHQSTEEPSTAVLADRLARLEERIEALTQPRGGAAAVPATDRAATDAPIEPGDDPTFWALQQLSRFDEPAVVYAGIAVSATGGPVRWQITRPTDELMDRDWSARATALGALGHPARLRLLQLVARGGASTAAELTEAAGLGSSGQVYHHLRALVAGGWLRAGARGRHEIPPERLVPLLAVLSAAD